jgi:hypothetical protein
MLTSPHLRLLGAPKLRKARVRKQSLIQVCIAKSPRVIYIVLRDGMSGIVRLGNREEEVMIW